jgi:hypothetical protein
MPPDARFSMLCTRQLARSPSTLLLPNSLGHARKAYHLHSVNPREMMGPMSMLVLFQTG